MGFRGVRVPASGHRISLRRRSRGDRIRNDGRRAAAGARRRGGATRLVDLGHGRGNDDMGRAAGRDARAPARRVRRHVRGLGGRARIRTIGRRASPACPQALENPVAVHAACTARPGPTARCTRSSVAARCSSIVDGRPTGTTGVAIDVTGREELVQTLQQSLLPAALPQRAGRDADDARIARLRRGRRSAATGTPRSHCPAAAWVVAIGDVAGHGLDAVADMAAARFSLRALALIDPQPDVVLDRLNQVVRVFGNDALITALYGVLDPHDHTWTYASAGHRPRAASHRRRRDVVPRRAARPAARNRR